MKKTKTALLVLFATICFAFSTQAIPKKLIRLNLEKGAVYEMTMNMTNNMDQEKMGQEIKMKQDMQMITSMNVDDVLPNHNYLVSYKYNSIKMTMDVMGKTMTFDTDHPDEGNPALKVMEGLTKVDLQMELTPQGKVVNVKGFDKFSDIFGGNPQLKNMLKMFSDQESFKANFSQTFNYFPDKKVGVGDTWDATQQFKSLMNMDIDMHFKVADVKKNAITLNVQSNINSDMPINQNGMKMEMHMKGSQNGEMNIDLNDGMLTQSNMKQSISMLMKMKNPQTLEDMEIPMKMNSDIKVIVTKK
ncbi:MAG TPA: DUF6263 family protein [Sunxiuqinia sp.]|nr:DUF6263 family protein [Sunxiuqinia sp.]